MMALPQSCSDCELLLLVPCLTFQHARPFVWWTSPSGVGQHGVWQLSRQPGKAQMTRAHLRSLVPRMLWTWT